MSAFNISLFVWRNALFQLPVSLKEADGITVLPITGVDFELFVAPVDPLSGTFGTPVLTDAAPTIDISAGTVLFQFTNVQTATLVITAAYQWMIKSTPTGGYPSVLIGGPLMVMDAPAGP